LHCDSGEITHGIDGDVRSDGMAHVDIEADVIALHCPQGNTHSFVATFASTVAGWLTLSTPIGSVTIDTNFPTSNER
jgi:hypothetical protein